MPNANSISFFYKVLESKFIRLEFVEITPYKRNVHLSIQLNRGTDKMVCKHLASQLKILRSQNLNMTSSLIQLQEEIKEKNKSLQMAETKDSEERAKQAANEAMFQRRMDDEILKEIVCIWHL